MPSEHVGICSVSSLPHLLSWLLMLPWKPPYLLSFPLLYFHQLLPPTPLLPSQGIQLSLDSSGQERWFVLRLLKAGCSQGPAMGSCDVHSSPAWLLTWGLRKVPAALISLYTTGHAEHLWLQLSVPCSYSGLDPYTWFLQGL